jgi:hypothetical protein
MLGIWIAWTLATVLSQKRVMTPTDVSTQGVTWTNINVTPVIGKVHEDSVFKRS